MATFEKIQSALKELGWKEVKMENGKIMIRQPKGIWREGYASIDEARQALGL
jgi:hypothetical protein